MAKDIAPVHHADRHTDVVMPYAPGIVVRRGSLVFLSGVTAAAVKSAAAHIGARCVMVGLLCSRCPHDASCPRADPSVTRRSAIVTTGSTGYSPTTVVVYQRMIGSPHA